MKFVQRFVTISLILLPWLCSAQTPDQDAVKQSFIRYKSAILNDNGEEAVRYVDSKTINYYSKLLDLVKSADSVSVEGLSLLDKLMVLIVRHRTPKEKIMKFDGRSMFIYAINSGMVGKNSVSSNTIGEVTVDKKFAKGQVLVNGKKALIFMQFNKEENIWKMDLTALFPMSNMAFKKVIEDSGENENEFMFKILESLTGKKPSAEIWQGVQ